MGRDERRESGGRGLDATREHLLIHLESLLRPPALVTRADDCVVRAHLSLDALRMVKRGGEAEREELMAAKDRNGSR